MFKENKSLIRILHSQLLKGLTHQWFLNQYVKKHKLKQTIIVNKSLTYHKTKGLISFKNWPKDPTRIYDKRSNILYNAEIAPLVLLTDIREVGGGWLGQVVMCSLCVHKLGLAWLAPEINITLLKQILSKFFKSNEGKARFCKCGRQKLLTACKPIYITCFLGRTETKFGLISNSFLIPETIYQIAILAQASPQKFQQILRPNTFTPEPTLVNERRPRPMEQLLQLMFFWLKNGRDAAYRMFDRCIPKAIFPELTALPDLTVPLMPVHNMPQEIQDLLNSPRRDRITIIVPAKHKILHTIANDILFVTPTNVNNAICSPNQLLTQHRVMLESVIEVRPTI